MTSQFAIILSLIKYAYLFDVSWNRFDDWRQENIEFRSTYYSNFSPNKVKKKNGKGGGKTTGW